MQRNTEASRSCDERNWGRRRTHLSTSCYPCRSEEAVRVVRLPPRSISCHHGAVERNGVRPRGGIDTLLRPSRQRRPAVRLHRHRVHHPILRLDEALLHVLGDLSPVLLRRLLQKFEEARAFVRSDVADNTDDRLGHPVGHGLVWLSWVVVLDTDVHRVFRGKIRGPRRTVCAVVRSLDRSPLPRLHRCRRDGGRSLVSDVCGEEGEEGSPVGHEEAAPGVRPEAAPPSAGLSGHVVPFVHPPPRRSRAGRDERPPRRAYGGQRLLHLGLEPRSWTGTHHAHRLGFDGREEERRRAVQPPHYQRRRRAECGRGLRRVLE